MFVYNGSILPGHVKLSDGSERDVTIKSVNAKKGDSLAVDQVILEFE